ncbi:MAG: AAA family ATPase [Candidatus Saccharimonadaceae bacterium]
MTHPDIKIVAFVGLPGSGKSEAVEYLTTKGYPKVYFGGVVLDAMAEAGIERTEENEQPFREGLRQTEGKDFIVNRIVQQINNLIDAGQHRIVADGIYSWTEYKVMRHAFPGELTVIALTVPKHIRHHRLSIRPNRPLTADVATERDWSEIENIEKGGPIAIADFFIDNSGDRDELHQNIDNVLEKIEF